MSTLRRASTALTRIKATAARMPRIDIGDDERSFFCAPAELDDHVKQRKLKMTSMNSRKAVVLFVAALAVGSFGAAFAQSAPGSQASDQAPTAAPRGEQTVRSLFGHADRNKDGQLTRAEAKVHLPITYQNFASIDTVKRGWISFEQFVEFTNRRVGMQADDILKIGQRL